MGAHILKPVKFKSNHVEQVNGFKCGSLPHETPLADWIKKQAFDALKFSKTKIWLYFTDDTQPLLAKNLVGYGSINSDELAVEEDDGSAGVIKVLTIPTIALDESFWGKPKVDDPEVKYSRQIVRHLQKEAKEWLKRSTNPPEPWLLLVVHPNAEFAQRLYRDCGFVKIPLPFHDKKTGIDCPRMMYRLT